MLRVFPSDSTTLGDMPTHTLATLYTPSVHGEAIGDEFNPPPPILKAGHLVSCLVYVLYVLHGLVRWVSFLFFS